MLKYFIINTRLGILLTREWYQLKRTMDIRCAGNTESGLLWLLVNEWDFQNCCLQYHPFVLGVVQTSPRKGFRERWSHFLEPWRAYSRPFLERWCDRFFYIKTRNIPQKRQFGSWIRGQDENRRWAPPEVHRLEWETRACQKRETTAKEKRGLVEKSYHLRNLNCILYNVISCVWMPALIADLFLPVSLVYTVSCSRTSLLTITYATSSGCGSSSLPRTQDKGKIWRNAILPSSVNVNVKQIPVRYKLNHVVFELILFPWWSHPLVDPQTNSVCLLTKDPQRQGSSRNTQY